MRREDLHGFAIDFGGTKVTAARINKGEIVASVTEPTNRSGDLLGQLDHFDRLLRRVGYADGARLGVAVTGFVSRSGHWSAVNTSTLPAIRNAPLVPALRSRYGEVACCNDAFAATLAEHRFGAGRGCDDFAYVTVSTGIGGGLVVNGKPVTGAHGFAGHFGFVRTDGSQDPCGSGRVGTFETIASGISIARRAEGMGFPGLSAKDIAQLSDSGTDWADRLIETSAKSIAALVADLAAIVDPETAALGGSIGLAPGYLERVTKHLAKEPEAFQVPVTVAQHGHDGPLLGAVANLDPE